MNPNIMNDLELINHKDKPLEFRMKWSSDLRIELTRSNVMEFFSRFFDINSQYTFIKTVANPDAVSAIYQARAKQRQNDKNPNNTEKNDKKPRLRHGYNNELVQIYNSTLVHFGEKQFGVNTCLYYSPIVQEPGLEYPIMEIPKIHVIRGNQNIEEYKSLVNKLNSNECFNYLKKRQAPWNYQLGEITLLKQEKINPLILDNAEWTVDGKNLKNALDFLVETRLHKDNTNWHDVD